MPKENVAGAFNGAAVPVGGVDPKEKPGASDAFPNGIAAEDFTGSVAFPNDIWLEAGDGVAPPKLGVDPNEKGALPDDAVVVVDWAAVPNPLNDGVGLVL